MLVCAVIYILTLILMVLSISPNLKIKVMKNPTLRSALVSGSYTHIRATQILLQLVIFPSFKAFVLKFVINLVFILRKLISDNAPECFSAPFSFSMSSNGICIYHLVLQLFMVYVNVIHATNVQPGSKEGVRSHWRRVRVVTSI